MILRPVRPESPCGPPMTKRPVVDEVAGALGEQLGGNRGLDDVLDHVALDGRVIHVGRVLGRDDDRLHADRPAVLIGHGHLGLAVGTQIGQQAALAHLGQAAGQAMRQGDGHGHVLGGLVAGIAEHHALVARADVVRVLGAALERVVHAHRDVAGLLVDVHQHRAGGAVKAVLGAVVADVDHLLAHDLLDRHIAVRADFAHDQHHAGRGAALAGHVGVRVFGEDRVQNRVGNLVADFVGMSLGHGFRGK